MNSALGTAAVWTITMCNAAKYQYCFSLIDPGKTPPLNEYREGSAVPQNRKHLRGGIKLQLQPWTPQVEVTQAAATRC